MRVILQQFYPGNNTTDAAAVNANNTAIQGSTTSNINGDNVRIEGIEMKNMKENPHIVYFDRQDNQAYEALGTIPSTYNGWIYNAFSIPGVFAGQHYSQIGTGNDDYEYPINHDNLFAINTNADKGTKMQINSTNGIALQQNQQIEIRWNVNIWDIYHNGLVARNNPGEYLSYLVDPLHTGVGIGEYFWIIYPKFNTVSNALLDDDFKSAQTAGFYQDLGEGEYWDATVNGLSQVNFDTRRFDHTSIVPIHFITGTNGGGNSGNFAVYFSADGNLIQRDTIGPPGQITGCHTFEVNKPAGGGKTLYGVQLFISGPHRLNAEGQFIENQRTNPGAGDFGVDVSIVLERAAVEVIIYTDASARRVV